MVKIWGTNNIGVPHTVISGRDASLVFTPMRLEFVSVHLALVLEFSTVWLALITALFHSAVCSDAQSGVILVLWGP